MKTRFSEFTYNELDNMEEAFCNEGLRSLVFEVRAERDNREEIKRLAQKTGEREISLLEEE